MGWQKIGEKRGERYDPLVVATRQPGLLILNAYGVLGLALNGYRYW
jgi:hypothetical protein